MLVADEGMIGATWKTIRGKDAGHLLMIGIFIVPSDSV
jgi:hypothetical protein